MSKNSLITFQLIPSYRQILLSQIQKSSIILSFDPLAFELKPFHWPLIDTEDKRVKPCNLLEYREQHHFRAPQCLCPLLQKLGDGEGLNIETAILEKKISGPGTGSNRIIEYVAECASGRCGYSVSLDQAYEKSGIPEKKYSSKTTTVTNSSQPSVVARPDVEQTRSDNTRPLKRTYAVADLADSIIIPKETKWRKFDMIGRMRNPGLSEADFLGLFARCDICQAITTRDVFRYHLEVCKGDVSAEDTELEEED